MNRDELGLICTKNNDYEHDGGDSAANEGTDFVANVVSADAFIDQGKEMSLVKLKIAIAVAQFKNALTQLQIAPGVLVRNPRLPWRNNVISRDNTTPMIVAAGFGIKLPEAKQFLKDILWNQIKNFGRYPNGDLPNYHVGIYVRSFRAWYLYWIPFLTDWIALFSLALKIGWVGEWKPDQKKFVKMNHDNSDDRNFILFLIQAYYICPTPWTWIMRKLYVRHRIKCFGQIAKDLWPKLRENQAQAEIDYDKWYLDSPGEDHRVMGALLWYFSEQFGGNPEMAETFRPAVRRIFK